MPRVLEKTWQFVADRIPLHDGKLSVLSWNCRWLIFGKSFSHDGSGTLLPCHILHWPQGTHLTRLASSVLCSVVPWRSPHSFPYRVHLTISIIYSSHLQCGELLRVLVEGTDGKEDLLVSHSVVSDSLWPHGLQHSRLPCPSLSPRVCSNSWSLSRWCHPTISSSVTLFSCLQSFLASGPFPVSWLCIRRPKYWSFSFSVSPSSEYSELI